MDNATIQKLLALSDDEAKKIIPTLSSEYIQFLEQVQELELADKQGKLDEYAEKHRIKYTKS